MRRGYCLYLAGLTAGLWLAGGCRSASPGDPNSPRLMHVGAVDTDEETAKVAEAHAHYAAGAIHEIDHDPAAALKEYYQAAQADPSSEWLVTDVSRRLVEAKEYEKALDLLKRASGSPQASGSVWAQLGFVYAQLGKTDQAIEANRTAIKKLPGSIAGYQNLYLVYVQNSRFKDALEMLEQAGKQPKPSVEFLFALSEMCANLALQAPALKDSAHAQALQALNRVEKSNPSSPGLRLKLAEGFGILGEFTKAAQVYLELLNSLGDLPVLRERVRARLAEIYLRGNDQPRAVEQLEAIVREDPTNPQAYYFLGNIALENRKWQQAIDHFNKTILLNAGFEQAYYDLANAQLAAGKISDALSTLERARKKFAQNFVLEFMTGLVMARQKAYDEAIRHYTAAEVIAKATEPKRLNQAFYFQLGAAYERKGEIAEAERYFEKCLQMAPDFAEALNYLGYMWAEHDMNLDHARQLIEKALQIEPRNAAYLDSLGWVLFRLHEPARALEYVLKAVELSEEPDPTVQDHLGDIYAALKQMDKAREAWKKSLSLEENEKVRKKLEPAGELK